MAYARYDKLFNNLTIFVEYNFRIFSLREIKFQDFSKILTFSEKNNQNFDFFFQCSNFQFFTKLKFSVAVRRRCSFGEITVEPPSDTIVDKKDGFEMNDGSTLMAPNGGSQVVASKSLLGVNVALHPNSRYRGKSKNDLDMVRFLGALFLTPIFLTLNFLHRFFVFLRLFFIQIFMNFLTQFSWIFNTIFFLFCYGIK